MTHKERFLRAITLKKVDRLPHTEQMIHDLLVAKIVRQELPGDGGNALSRWMNEPMSAENFERHVQARKFLGFDHVQLFPMETSEQVGVSAHGNPLVRDIWGCVMEKTDKTSVIVKMPIESADEIDAYRFPDVDDFGFGNIRLWLDEGSFFVAPQIETGYFKANQFFGIEDYVTYLYDEPGKMHGFMRRFTDFQIRMAQKLIDMGVDGIWLSDDHAYNKGPFMSSAFMQEFDFDYMKQIVDYIHDRGKPVILHSCGNLSLTIDQIVATGIDALHAIQPSLNDIYAFKRKYGKKICLIGNMDIQYLLPHGSPIEIAGKIDEMVEKLFYDQTGFVLSTCNLLDLDVPVENVITMHLAAQKYVCQQAK